MAFADFTHSGSASPSSIHSHSPNLSPSSDSRSLSPAPRTNEERRQTPASKGARGSARRAIDRPRGTAGTGGCWCVAHTSSFLHLTDKAPFQDMSPAQEGQHHIHHTSPPLQLTHRAEMRRRARRGPVQNVQAPRDRMLRLGLKATGLDAGACLACRATRRASLTPYLDRISKLSRSTRQTSKPNSPVPALFVASRAAPAPTATTAPRAPAAIACPTRPATPPPPPPLPKSSASRTCQVTPASSLHAFAR